MLEYISYIASIRDSRAVRNDLENAVTYKLTGSVYTKELVTSEENICISLIYRKISKKNLRG